MAYTQEQTGDNIANENIHQEHFISDYEFEGFEGPEKKLEFDFRYIENNPLNNGKGLRQLVAQEWQEQLLDDVHCKIISQTSNQYLDSYVLSESSLFVYPFKLILKTCGTTTLLRAVAPILSIAKNLGMTVDFCWFSRKNYVFPHKQLAPHTSWEDEVKYLDQYFPHGNGFIVGPMSKDHWYLYVADYRHQHEQEEYVRNNNHTCEYTHMVANNDKGDQTFEVLMHELSPETMKQFFKDENFVSSEQTTISSGIADLLPGSVIDAFQFEPCGYSMNGLLGDSYWTIHITPEDSCSFASFETNYLPSKGAAYYDELLHKVLKVFQPGRFSVTLLADDHVPAVTDHKNSGKNPHQKTLSAFSELHLSKFSQLTKSFYEFEGGYNMTFCSFEKKKVVEQPYRASFAEKKLVIDASLKNKVKAVKMAQQREEIDENVSDSSASDSELERDDLYSPLTPSPYTQHERSGDIEAM